MSTLLSPLALAYRAGVAARHGAYRRGWFKTRRLSRPVISVGNLSVGGAGKTPLVAYIAERLLARGLKPAILTRGYGRRGRSLVAIEPDAGLVPEPRQVGDEPALLAQKLPDVPIVISANRYAAGCYAESAFKVDVHLLDDGFQHWALARDLDVVVIDSTREGQKLLPAGALREPWSALDRAQIVVLTRTEVGDPGSIEARVREINPQAKVFRAATQLTGLAEVRGGGRHTDSLAAWRARPVLAFCGLGNPEAFFRDLKLWGFTLAATARFCDHHVYRAQDLVRLFDLARKAGARACLTTEKDAIKLPPLPDPDLAVAACAIRAEILEAEAFEAAMMKVVEARASCPHLGKAEGRR